MPSLCNQYIQQLLYIQTLHNVCSHMEDMHHLPPICAHFMSIFSSFWGLELRIFSVKFLDGVWFVESVYIQTLHYDCLHIKHVHSISCVHLKVYLRVLDLEIITSTQPTFGVLTLCNLCQTDFTPLYSNFA